MGTTVDDLIALKDQACGAAYTVAALLDDDFVARFKKATDPEHGSNDDEHELLLELYEGVRNAKSQADDVVNADQLYDAADESDASSIEDYEENYS